MTQFNSPLQFEALKVKLCWANFTLKVSLVNDSLAFGRRLLENAFLAMQQHRKKDGKSTTQSRKTIKVD